VQPPPPDTLTIPSPPRAARPRHLSRAISGSEFFALGFGTIIGVGWIIVLGDWLRQAGPVGAILAFIAGGLVMTVVGLCYAELATLLPVSGGELAYAYETYGVKACFAAGWALALVYIGFTAFEAVSLGWVLGALLPGIEGPTLYLSRGEPVRLGSLLLGLGGMALFTYLNYRGARSAARTQKLLTYTKIGFSAVFIIAGIIGGSTVNLHPLFAERTPWRGILAVFLTTPVWFGGFNVIPQAMEERAPGTSLRTVGLVIILSLGLATVFYCLIILASSMTMPWQSLVRLDLPAAGAFQIGLGSTLLARVVLLAALLGLIATWNAVFFAAARVLFALGRARIINPSFGAIHPVHGSPAAAVLFVGAVGTCAVFIGRSAIIPIVNVGATCLAGAFLLTCLSVIRMRRLAPDRPRPYSVPGGTWTAGIAVLFCLGILGLSLFQPYADAKGRMPLEWIFLGLWIVMGTLFWRYAHRNRDEVSAQERRRLILGDATAAP
jgi:basic amino acid/polyamine antiporter, APA family